MADPKSQLTMDTAMAYAKLMLNATPKELEELRPLLDLQVRSLNVIRSLKVDKGVEPDIFFSPEGG